MDGVSYKRGAVVNEKGKYYEGMGESNKCKPGDNSYSILYALYNDPDRTLKTLEDYIYGLMLVEFVLMLLTKSYLEMSIGLLMSMFIFFQIIEYREKIPPLR